MPHSTHELAHVFGRRVLGKEIGAAPLDEHSVDERRAGSRRCVCVCVWILADSATVAPTVACSTQCQSDQSAQNGA